MQAHAHSTNGASVSYYDVLQVPPQASDEDIRKAYHRLAGRLHPDRNPRDRKMAELRMRLVNEAYDHLKTRKARTAYDRMLRSQMRALTASARNDNRSAAIRPAAVLIESVRSGIDTVLEIFWPFVRPTGRKGG